MRIRNCGNENMRNVPKLMCSHRTEHEFVLAFNYGLTPIRYFQCARADIFALRHKSLGFLKTNKKLYFASVAGILYHSI